MNRSTWFAVFMLGTVVGTLAVQAAAQTAPAGRETAPTATQAGPMPAVDGAAVNEALRRGVDFLLKARLHDNWERNPTWQTDKQPQVGGETAMALWALLTLGQGVDDPRLDYKSEELAPAVAWLLNHEPETVYVAAVKANVLALLPSTPEFQRAQERVKQSLTDAQLDGGGFSYALGSRNPVAVGLHAKPALAAGPWDASNSGYGVQGVFAAVEAQGVPERSGHEFWTASEKFWRTGQNADGGWGYSATQKASRPSLSAAGVASLYLIAAANPPAIAKPDAALALGLAYVTRTFNPHPADEPCDYLYAIARVGRGSGLRRLGGVNWYDAGAGALLAGQQPNGSWAGPSSIVATSYALLFLVKGREPLAFSKLELGSDVQGALAATDAWKLSRYLSHALQQPLGWRIVSLRDSPDDFAAAPILLIVAPQDPQFSPAALDHLRSFCQNGGLIFSTGAGAAVKDAMGRYATAMARGNYTFRKLAPDHALFPTSGRGGIAPALWGVGNGIREWWIHAPTDFDTTWRRSPPSAGDAWRVPANLLRYVTGGTGLARVRLVPPGAAPPATAPAPVNVTLAQVRYQGNWNPEPDAWPKMATTTARKFGINLQLAETAPAELDAKQITLAHLTGTATMTLPADQQAALEAYIDHGGLLLIDAAGGAAEFAASARALIATLYPNAKLEAIPLNSPIYNGSIPHSSKADKVVYRRFAKHTGGDERSPRLEGITLGGRYGIIFSADDMTSGLLETNTWGIAGYTPKSAQTLARNVLAYAAQTRPQEGP